MTAAVQFDRYGCPIPPPCATCGLAHCLCCRCGSGERRRELVDARGIFCTFVCDRCEAERRSEFRAEIFTDGNYDADEPIGDGVDW